MPDQLVVGVAHVASLFSLQLEAATCNAKQFEVLRKALEEKCAAVPKLQRDNEDLKKKLKESFLLVAEFEKIEKMVKVIAAERDALRADAAAADTLRKEMKYLKEQLEASAVASLQKDTTVARLSDEIMASKVEAALKQKTVKHEISSVELSKELLEDVSFWRKKCVKAESELHELKVSIAADARRSFLAIAIEPRAQQQGLRQVQRAFQ